MQNNQSKPTENIFEEIKKIVEPPKDSYCSINYDVYLFSCLVKLYDRNFASQPYDVQFDVLPMYFHQFELSEFNDKDKGLYECIVNYLKHHFENNTLDDWKK